MHYDRTVTGYHGCDQRVAEQLLDTGIFKPSVNDYDWLGHGIYFWEWGLDRAWRFAQEQKDAGRIDKPAVIGAIIQLGRCLDLMDTRFTHDVKGFFPLWKEIAVKASGKLPRNKGGPPYWKGRYLDCAVLNAYVSTVGQDGVHFDTVRAGFIEGGPIFEGAGLTMETHIQIAVRNPGAIVGVFKPTPGRQP